jgi:transcriptional regulator with XRE-family HTH domain
MNSEFSDRLKQACNLRPELPRKGAGLHAWLKNKMGVSHETISKWFSGEARPRPARMKELANVLGVNEAWLAVGSPLITSGEQKALEARQAGIENIFMGLMKLNGAHCAAPDETESESSKTSFYAIREGVLTRYAVLLAEEHGYSFVCKVPINYHSATVVASICTESSTVMFYKIPHGLIETFGKHMGGYIRLDMLINKEKDSSINIGEAEIAKMNDFTD